jgi:hypothetical protein
MHNINHKILSLDFKNFFKDIDITSMFLNKNLETWNGERLPTTELLNDNGLDFFKSNKIELNDLSTIFITPTNHKSFIHCDTKNNKICRINYILHGEGKMIWYSLNNYTEKTITRNSMYDNAYSFIEYKDISNEEIIEIWDGQSGECAITNINSPHNIVTTDSNRIVLSIKVNESFEKLCELLD